MGCLSDDRKLRTGPSVEVETGPSPSLKLKSSMASPCALPVESVICQTTQSAAPDGQLIGWSVAAQSWV